MFLLFLLLTLFAQPVSAAGSVAINNTPSSIVTNDSFAISYSASNLGIGNTYFIKAFGGTDTSTTQVYTVFNNQSLSSSANWSDFPYFVIDAGGSSSGIINANIPGVSGPVNLKLRIALTSNTNTQVTSPNLVINVVTPTITPTLSPTLTPTLAPTNTPLPTSTPSPTNTPSPTPTSSLTSTLTPTPKITITPTLTPLPTPSEAPVIEPSPVEPNILGATDDPITPTNQPSNSTLKTGNLPQIMSTIFIVLGCLLLFTPLIVLKLKK